MSEQGDAPDARAMPALRRAARSMRDVDIGAGQLLQLAPVRWLRGWWKVAQFGAQMLVLMLSPSSYRRSQHAAIYRQIHEATVPPLPVFLTLSALLSVVIIRIVVVTADSYGLSRYALDVLVRTLVIELLPLLVALFVALRFTMPSGEDVARQREHGLLLERWRTGGDPARDDLLPRVLAGIFAVVFLAVISGVLALVLTYLMIYGFTSWGFAAYTRDVGHVFIPRQA